MSFEHLALQPTRTEMTSNLVSLPIMASSKQIYKEEVSGLRDNNTQLPIGILVVNNQGRMIGLNRKFISMWALSQEIVRSQSERQAIELVSKQFEDPIAFFREMKEIYQQKDSSICDSIELKNGRVFERMTEPQWLGGQIVGRIWQFRQII